MSWVHSSLHSSVVLQSGGAWMILVHCVLCWHFHASNGYYRLPMGECVQISVCLTLGLEDNCMFLKNTDTIHLHVIMNVMFHNRFRHKNCFNMVWKSSCFGLKYPFFGAQYPMERQKWVAKKHPHLGAKNQQEKQPGVPKNTHVWGLKVTGKRNLGN